MKREVVVTGIGAVSPLGVGATVLYERWRDGSSGIENGEGAATEFDPTDHLSVKEARRSDRFAQFAMVAGDEALASAGWDRADMPYEASRIGCVYGTGIGGIGTLERGKQLLLEQGEKKVPPLSVPLMMSNAAPGMLAMRYGIHGDSFGTVSACAASLHAIAQATRMIQYGDADAVVTGGAEAALTPLSKAAFARLEAVSPRGISQPFDARRDGFVMGEGGAVLLLEDAEKAAERGAKVLARVRGFGATSDAHHLTAPHPEGVGATAAIRRALEDSEVKPEQIAYINAHGTSTPLNDRAETKAIKAALGEHAANIPVSSTKSAIGHLLGAAGAVETVATILALSERIAPPTLNWEEREEGMDLDYVPGKAKPLEVNGGPVIALSNAFGFGGHNVVLCLEVE
ncbi:MAG TPA: beta-ketoacyl-ACP synthase II [Solirubrobacteraceae bacterium]